MKLQKFERYEFKYILDTIQREKIENDVKNFMELDNFAKKNKSYFVRSLYFDDPNYINYYEKIDGMKLRHKFRLRTYGKDYSQDIPIFLEVKGRINQRTYKKRLKIDKKDLSKFEGLEDSIKISKDEMRNDLISFFTYERLKKNIKPMVLTDYQRSPYVSNYDRNFRVTFDKKFDHPKNR